MLALRVAGVLLGTFVVAATVGSSIRTVILPRGVAARLSRVVFILGRAAFELRVGRSADYGRRDRILALYGPASLLLLLLTWIVLLFGAYTVIFWSITGSSLQAALALSGSSLFTLGFEAPRTLPATLLAFTEAALGLVELALLITYMPTLYSAFQRREWLVTTLEVRAGSPPSGLEMLLRYHRLKRIDRLPEDVWIKWEDWFADVEETHTSLPALAFFRSPQPDRSWITAAGAVLDAASLMRSSVDLPPETEADLTIRAGYIALRRIATFFRIRFNNVPAPDDPISVAREEFDQALDTLEAAGLPVKADREQAWRDFRGWRVNYDTVLVVLAQLVSAPPAPWSSDRGSTRWRPPGLRALLGLEARAEPA